MTHLTDKQAEALIEQKERAKREPSWLSKFKRRLAMPRDKCHRIYNRYCRMLASKTGREGSGKTIPYDDCVENKKLQIAINKYNRIGEEE